jgi:hypothetical protein
MHTVAISLSLSFFVRVCFSIYISVAETCRKRRGNHISRKERSLRVWGNPLSRLQKIPLVFVSVCVRGATSRYSRISADPKRGGISSRETANKKHIEERNRR